MKVRELKEMLRAAGVDDDAEVRFAEIYGLPHGGNGYEITGMVYGPNGALLTNEDRD